MMCVAQDVLAWVIAQPWCNGKIGTGGISYDGMSAFRLASVDPNNHVKAVALMFSPTDPFKELIAPGTSKLLAMVSLSCWISFDCLEE